MFVIIYMRFRRVYLDKFKTKNARDGHEKEKKNDRKPNLSSDNIIELDHRCRNTIRACISLSRLRAASWVFRERAIGFPGAIGDRASASSRNQRSNRRNAERTREETDRRARVRARARAYTPVEYLIGRNNYRLRDVYTRCSLPTGPCVVLCAYVYTRTRRPIISRARSVGPAE